MAQYSFKGAWPTRLPNRIKFSNGLTKTDKTTFTDQDLIDAGWIEVEDPPAATYPNKLEWNGETFEWSVRGPNESEIFQKRQEIQISCMTMLTETDYKVVKAMEIGEQLDSDYINYRQSLRDLYNDVMTMDPFSVTLPTPPEDSMETANTP